MRESIASLLSQTSNGAVNFMVATIPEDVMHAFEDDPALSPPAKKISNSDAANAPWERLHQNIICPHRLTHPRTHLLAVAGLLVTGVLVYVIALHMEHLYSQEATLWSTLNQTSPSLDSVRAPPTYMNNSASLVDANSSAVDSALDYTNDTRDSSAQLVTDSNLNVSILGASSQSGIRGWQKPPPKVEIPGATIFYQNMSETWHTMNDERLLQRASSVQPSGASHVARIAYMFMTRGPLPFVPLWERYFRGHEQLYTVYIHAHPDYVPAIVPTSPFFRRFIPSKVVEWGKLSLYEAERRLLGNALLEQTNEWFLLLSESCIPVFSFPETYSYFNHSQGMSFIESFVDLSHLGLGRLFRENYKAMTPEITQKNFLKGSQWFQINRDLALSAAADSKEYAKFEKYFCEIHSTCYIDEHFLPTLAWIVRPHAIAYRTLTHYEFNGISAHPKKYSKTDTNENLIQWFRTGHSCLYNGQTTTTCHLFARKIDPDALRVLLDLAGPIMEIP